MAEAQQLTPKTPEEYYQQYYKRAIEIAEAWLKIYPRPDYSQTETIQFDFDPNSEYLFQHYEGDFTIFKRISDGAIAKFSKYSHIQLN